MMDFSVLDCTSLAAEAWTNGGGVTRTIARDVDAAGATVWRVSMATLDGPARFSLFPGVDRTFVLIDGGPVELHAQHGATLAHAGEPMRFSGDLHLWANLHTGPASALNVMTRRDTCRAAVDVASDSIAITPAATHLLVSLSDAWDMSGEGRNDVRLPRLHAVRLDGARGPLRLKPAGSDARPLIVSIAIESAEESR